MVRNESAITVGFNTEFFNTIGAKLPLTKAPGASASRLVRDEKPLSTSLPKYQAEFAIFMLPNKRSALTIADGSNLREIASRFLKSCRLPLPGMVTWGKI
jgi:hypothetical protein